MRLPVVAAISALLAVQTSALSPKNVLGDHGRVYQRQEIDEAMYPDVDAMLARIRYQKRAPIPQQTATAENAAATSAGASSGGEVDSGGNFDEAAFNTSATGACIGPLSSLTSVVNPSGMAACYNIPFLDNATGVFEADIRLFRVTPPTGEFAGVQPGDLRLGVMIPQATLSDPRTLGSSSSTSSQQAESAAMEMLEEFQHVGQINTDLMASMLDEQQLRILLTPNITVAAQNKATGQLVETTLSSDTISYVAGVLVDPNNNNITVPEASAQLSTVVSSATPFTMPGMTLGIFPIGLIITGAWTLIFISAVTYGTFERMKFRAHYRRRVMRADTFGAGGPGTI